MFRLEKEFTFEAAHHLPKHDGKCRRVHGHSWKGKLICEGYLLNENDTAKAGMLVDYGDMSKAINSLIEEKLDHYDLNETLPLENPTSEEISRWIFDQVKRTLPLLVAVVIEETCTSRCEYRP